MTNPETAVSAPLPGTVAPTAFVPEDMKGMMEAAKGLDVNALERLVALHERAADRVARQEFNAAFAKFQRECPPIVHDRVAKFATTAGAGVEYSYATLAAIARSISTPLHDNGFSYSWDTEISDRNLKVVCTLEHEGGWKRTASFVCRIEPSKLQSDAQATKAAQTFAERCSLISAAGLTTAEDDIDGAAGAPQDLSTIGPGQAEELGKLIVESKVDREKFLKFLDAKSVEEIRITAYEKGRDFLRAKIVKNAGTGGKREAGSDG